MQYSFYTIHDDNSLRIEIFHQPVVMGQGYGTESGIHGTGFTLKGVFCVSGFCKTVF